YGFACDLNNLKAVSRLFAIKQRSANQPVSALFSSIEEARKYVEWNDQAEQLAQEFLPGRLMIVLLRRNNTPYALHPTPQSHSPTLGIRVSSHPIAMELVQKFGRPISTTSANLHGKPSPYSIKEILEQYKDAPEKPDLILDSGPLPLRKPSRIIDCTGSSQTILRA
ncbi:MAG: tRNA threonylcarbamoyladenosine biosynthesis protein, partial [Candidatus Peregrinibacteria bacterium Greene1014_49]